LFLKYNYISQNAFTLNIIEIVSSNTENIKQIIWTNILNHCKRIAYLFCYYSLNQEKITEKNQSLVKASQL